MANSLPASHPRRYQKWALSLPDKYFRVSWLKKFFLKFTRCLTKTEKGSVCSTMSAVNVRKFFVDFEDLIIWHRNPLASFVLDHYSRLVEEMFTDVRGIVLNGENGFKNKTETISFWQWNLQKELNPHPVTFVSNPAAAQSSHSDYVAEI